MQKLSRRALADWAADELAAGRPQRDVARRLAAVLVATKRGNQALQLTQDVAYVMEDRGLSVNARVVTAHRSDAALSGLIKQFIAKETGTKNVNVEHKIDESLLGGAIIETAKSRWDTTIVRKLTDIREAF